MSLLDEWEKLRPQVPFDNEPHFGAESNVRTKTEFERIQKLRDQYAALHYWLDARDKIHTLETVMMMKLKQL
jgi:hypothetical protein